MLTITGVEALYADKALFLTLARNAANPVAYFRLPDERTIVMGGHINI